MPECFSLLPSLRVVLNEAIQKIYNLDCHVAYRLLAMTELRKYFIYLFRGLLILLIFLLPSCSFTQTNEAPVVDLRNQQELARGYHIVARGETLYFIAWRFGLDYQELAKRNGLAAPYHVKVGEKIYLQGMVPASKTAHKKAITAKVGKKTTAKKSTAPTHPAEETQYNFARVKKWLRPAQGTIIHNFSALNKGVDIAGREGEPVRATAAGEIVYAGDGLRSYGNLLLIKHNDEYISAYAHNERLLVKEGQFVQAGQEIATMGKTGTNRVMLHFELRKRGKPVNPLHYF